MIMVVDGQGGGIGRALVAALRVRAPQAEILALGTNVLATSAMLKAGASAGATGENAICYNAPRAQVIAGPIGILLPDAMLGELTAAMAAAIGSSPAKKVLIPLEKCQVHVVGGAALSLPQLVEQAAQDIAEKFL